LFIIGIYYGMREIIKRELNLFKSSINENLDISDDEMVGLIKNYSGSNKMINDFKKKVLFLNQKFTEKQKEAAKDFFIKEKLSNTIFAQLDVTTNLGRDVVKSGIDTYVNLIKSGKKHLFKTREDLTIKVGTPGPEWIQRNINDLTELKNKLSEESLSKTIDLPSGEVTTIKAKVEEILNTLQTDPNAYPGFIEKGEWSIVNKLDTNYSNWFRILGELDSQGKLKGNSAKQKVENFFKQVPVSELLSPQKVENLRAIESEFGVEIPTLSQADFEILREYNKDFLNIKKRLMSSTERGDKNEHNITGTIKLFSGDAITDSDIIHFSSHGNRVDQVFGIDMLVYMYVPAKGNEKYWVPIQAKSDKFAANKSILLKFDIGGIAVFPTKNPEIIGNYGYLTVRAGTEKSLDELLVYNKCRLKEDSQSCKKFDK
jgi:hypothetical protein